MSDPELGPEELELPPHALLRRGLAQFDRLEPPPELDRIVLARAREAIGEASAPRYYRSPRWALAFGLAAALVLACAALVMVHGVRSASSPAALATSPSAPASAAGTPAVRRSAAERTARSEATSASAAPAHQ